jgi:hypothetical protein
MLAMFLEVPGLGGCLFLLYLWLPLFLQFPYEGGQAFSLLGREVILPEVFQIVTQLLLIRPMQGAWNCPYLNFDINAGGGDNVWTSPISG